MKVFIIASFFIQHLVNQVEGANEVCEADGTCYYPSKDGPCEDKHAQCEQWATAGECKGNPNYMLNSCEVSCSVCDDDFDSNDGDCTDKHPRCMQFASLGECENNSDYMSKSCPRSCNLCHNVVNDDRCIDIDESGKCPFWAKTGECINNKNFMQKNCRASCLICIDDAGLLAEGMTEEEIERIKVYSSLDLGEDQSVVDDENFRKTLGLMDIYARETLTHPDMLDVRSQCKNENHLCAYWSSIGLCNANPTFMQKSCPLACLTCGYISKFNRCKRDLDTKPVFDKGGIDTYFNGLKSGLWEEFRPTFVTMPNGTVESDPWILRFENFLTSEEIEHLVTLGESIGFKPDENENVSKVTCTKDNSCEEDSVYRQIVERISKITTIPDQNFENMLITKSERKESSNKLVFDYVPHDSWLPAGSRIFSLYIFLSDEDKGGGVGFPGLDWLAIKPRKGHAILWPNVLNTDLDRPDERMAYEVFPATDGEVIFATFWLHLYDYKTHVDNDCI